MAMNNVETLRHIHQCWNNRDFDGESQGYADNVTYTDNATGQIHRNKPAVRQNSEMWAKAFSNGKITDARYIDAGDTVVTEFIGEGTNDGSFAGHPPSGRRVKSPMCEIVRFDKSGRVISISAYYDLNSLLVQLGHSKPLSRAA